MQREFIRELTAQLMLEAQDANGQGDRQTGLVLTRFCNALGRVDELLVARETADQE